LRSAADTYQYNHRLEWIIPVAFAMRFGQIWLFAWLWWKSRPANKEAKSALE